MDEVNLVTGATGFVGGAVSRALLMRGKKVRIFARSEEKSRSLKEKGAEVCVEDLRDGDALRRAVEGVTTVYHIGAVFRQAKFNEEGMREVNAAAVANLISASSDAGGSRFIHCSTIGVLGDIKNPPGNEETEYAPGDGYQRTKCEGEIIALEAFRSQLIPGCAMVILSLICNLVRFVDSCRFLLLCRIWTER